MSDELENWACSQLDSMGLPDASVIIQYLEPLENPREVEDYLNSMLDTSQLNHRQFIKEFLERQAKCKIDKRFYMKSNLPDNAALLQDRKKGKEKNAGSRTSIDNSSAKDREKKISKKIVNTDKENQFESKNHASTCNSSQQQNSKPTNKKVKEQNTKEVSPTVEVCNTQPAQIQGKKKTKFVSLYSDDGASNDVVLLSGRHMCECLASKHKLVNNCLSCGRIVCTQEGAGPCLFCGNLVQSKEDRDGMLGVTAAASTNMTTTTISEPCDDTTKSKPMSLKEIADDIQKAVNHKNRLLEYDRTSEKRTKVFDDESDYFDSNSRWLSKSDREVLQARENELLAKKYDRQSNKITIDLLGRKIILDETNDGMIYDPDDPIVKSILERESEDIFSSFERSNLPAPQSLQRPVYVENPHKLTDPDRPLKFPMGNGNKMSRLQDRELQEMSDQGRCLSMHQPYASLLVAGIKQHEGRAWYSAHRGRLWIASAAKTPLPEEVNPIEDFYRARVAGKDVVFPQHYSPGCLLGCVDVLDVLPQEEYRKKFPDGESESPFVFICTNPQEMIFKFPMKGQHQIFKLDSKIHQAAKKALK